MPWYVLLITHRSVMNVTRFPFARHCCALKKAVRRIPRTCKNVLLVNVHLTVFNVAFQPSCRNGPTKMECLALADILGKRAHPGFSYR